MQEVILSGLMDPIEAYSCALHVLDSVETAEKSPAWPPETGDSPR